MDPNTLVITSIIVEVIVGVILGRMIWSQKALIDHYKTLLDTISPAKLKEAQDFIIAGMEAKSKVEIMATVEKISQDFRNANINMNETFINRYNELMGMIVSSIAPLDLLEQEKALKFFPQAGPAIREHIEFFRKEQAARKTRP